MKKTLFSVATVTALTGVASTNISADEYTVESGDTLSGIAEGAGTTVDQLKEFNELSSDLIMPGDVVSVDNDDEASAEETADQDGTYTIQSGDTLSSIAAQYDVTVDDLKAWNNLSSDLIYAGKTLSVSGDTQSTEVVEEEQVESSEPAAEEVEENNDNTAQAAEAEETTEVVEEEQVESSEPAAEEVEENNDDNARAAETEEEAVTSEPAAPSNTTAESENNTAQAAETAEPVEEYSAQEQVQEPAAEEETVQEQSAEEPQAPAASSSNTGGNAASVAHSVAAGKSYVHGANSATAVDCSALTQQFMKEHKGVDIPRTVSGQQAAGTQVSNPQAGDLVVFNGGTHVGIYIGNGQMVDALNPSEHVGERSVDYVNGSIDGYYRF